jgi:peptide/nickel transport system permease protein
MRVMDGLMAIPAILLAIALVSLSGASLLTVIWPCHPEMPRVVRLVRSHRADDPRGALCRSRHLGGHAGGLVIMAPHAAQHHRAADRAGHLHRRLGDPAGGHPVVPGRGHPAGDPHLGQHHGRGPQRCSESFPHNILYPGIFLTLTVLAINMLGDGLRDTLDPRMAKK